MRKALLLLSLTIIISAAHLQAQEKAEVRGFVYEAESGEPAPFVNIFIVEAKSGNLSDENGFYTVSNIPPGTYTFVCYGLGYDTVRTKIKLKAGQSLQKNVYLPANSYEIQEVRITAEKQKKKTDTYVSVVTITPRELKSIPTVGGAPDLVQYLQLLPGVVFSGDQGGQLYIRGGSPVMNRVMLDGMTIYNPFHSIGLFSVFDADIIQSAEVYSAGFGAEYGGRVSAIVDVKTRDGNSNHFAGKLNTNPFTSKVLLEGPLRKFQEGEGFSSFILSYKNSYLEQSSRLFYNYADPSRLPYTFSDLYGKMSFNSAGGSKMDIFGFDYRDRVDFQNTTSYEWNSNGIGTNFLLLPYGSKTLIDGVFTFSDYEINQIEADQRPRRSGINGFNVILNFGYFIDKDELTYGLEVNGFRTEFEIFNSANRRIQQFENTTELASYIRYKKIIKEKLILEPGFRVQWYASLGNISPEPRLRFKYNFNQRWRLKGAGGWYSQNLLSAMSDRDVVNLFYGFLSGPDDLPPEIGDKEITHRMQTARHAVLGVEYDINLNSDINFETYVKDFTQISNINRDKIFDDTPEFQDEPDFLRKSFIVETGLAYGFDITYQYKSKQFFIWLVYAWNLVNRFDGQRTYNPHFDRRHNVNLVGSYRFGKDERNEVSLRWNLGSGFPFTQTQGFYENINFSDGIGTDYTRENGELGIYFADLNLGRLPYYHRLDFSAKHERNFKSKSGKERMLEYVFSCTNVYNRNNIFYFDRVSYQRVDQLPILPSFAITYGF
jgi:hypothetical protein